MGAGASNPEDNGADVVGREQGFRVHRVEPNSPGYDAGLQSITDYIVVANGVRLDSDDGSFVKLIQENKGKEMRLCVFNTHTLRTRETILLPNDQWGGTGLLGITIRFDVLQSLDKHTLHVLDVYPDSPASAAGLDEFNDYILGCGDLLFDGPDEFGEIVQHNTSRPVRLYLYNVRTEAVREVMITPDTNWGGEGCLGCGVGAGYLHQLPQRRDRHDGRKAALPPQPAAAPVEPPQAPATAPPAEVPAEMFAEAPAEAPAGAPAEAATATSAAPAS